MHRIHTAGLLLASSLLTACASPRLAPLPLAYHGQASLPLSGDWAAHGNAFRNGFLNGLGHDSLQTWVWHWHDNFGDPLEVRAWTSATPRPAPDLRLLGLGPATERLAGITSPVPCLWLGDGGPAPFANVWPLWSDNASAQTLLDSLRDALPAPLAVVTVADGGWTAPIFTSLRTQDSVVIHDPEAERWKRETDQIQQSAPASLLFWNAPRDARALSQQAVLRQRDSLPVVLPEGVATAQRGPVWRFQPLWQPSLPADSAQLRFLEQWGFSVGSALCASCQGRKTKPKATEWLSILRNVPSDSLRTHRPGGGWAPRLRVYRDSLH